MNVSYSHRLATRRVLTGGLLLAAIGAAAAAAGPAAIAAPSSPAQSAQHAAGSLARKGLISWSIAPASATKVDTTRVKFFYTNIKPGSTITDHVAILNESRQGVSFAIYATDATGTTAANTLVFLPGTKKPTDIGSWSSFPRHVTRLSIIIPAGKGVIEPFTIAVPRHATPGDHTGGMVASVGFQRKTASGSVVTEDQRIVVPVELRVAGALHAGLRVESISAGYHGSLSPFGSGSASVSYTLHNTGNIRLAGSQLVSVTGPFGVFATIKTKSLPTVLPGDSVRLTAQPEGLYPAGPLTAHVHVTPGVPVGAPPLTAPVRLAAGSAGLFAVPWGLILLIILVAGITVGGWQARKWRRRRLRATLTAVAEKVRLDTERRLIGDAGASAAGPQRQA